MEMRDKGNYGKFTKSIAKFNYQLIYFNLMINFKGFFIPEDKVEEAALDSVILLNTILNYLSPNIVKIKPGN